MLGRQRVQCLIDLFILGLLMYRSSLGVRRRTVMSMVCVVPLLPRFSVSPHGSTWLSALLLSEASDTAFHDCCVLMNSPAMAGIMITLFILHRRSREVAQEKRAQYWREQVSLD